ncbi:hypothetical protein SAMN02910456_01119 [Ruminococcaceae bacterium YRB3002]|nr:hypothetical protein SAMN02910456_01119 [Ruminococcaceae bacterium YRB3002]
MSKVSKNYIAVWGVMLALFNLIVFISPGWGGIEKYTGAFWIAYAITTMAFVLHLAFALIAFKDAGNSKQKLFLNIPIIWISYVGLIITIIVGALCMLNSFLPTWAAGVTMGIVLAVFLLSVVKTKIAIEAVEDVGARVADKTAFIKSLRVDADSLVGKASSPTVRDMCTKVSEAIRYSDPVSNDMTAAVEKQITTKLAEFTDVVKAGDEEKVSSVGSELIDLVDERNKKCKLGK